MGRDPQDLIDCPTCDGSGEVPNDEIEQFDECPTCEGSGEVYHDDLEDDTDYDLNNKY